MYQHNFNPRTPYGMRPFKIANGSHPWFISIHAPLTGCDFLVCYLLGLGKNFNPRTPYGMRLYARHTLLEKRSISIHAPLTGCDDSVRAC